jgi:signal transduction histidine kinase
MGEVPSGVDVDTGGSLPDNQRKDTFVATLAHELRQPLSAMSAALEVVRGAPDSESARRATDAMGRQIQEMSRLVEDLVDAKRLASGKVSLQKCLLDLQGVIEDAVSDVTIAAAEGGLELVVAESPDPAWIEADRQRLLQVFLNLLRNALAYTPPGGRITVTVERADSMVRVRIADTGRGIEPHDLTHVFDLFSQLRPQESTGLGIGLSIVREVVLLHGGSIEARSDGAWKGSEFILTLPLAKIPPSA